MIPAQKQPEQAREDYGQAHVQPLRHLVDERIAGFCKHRRSLATRLCPRTTRDWKNTHLPHSANWRDRVMMWSRTVLRTLPNEFGMDDPDFRVHFSMIQDASSHQGGSPQHACRRSVESAFKSGYCPHQRGLNSSSCT